MNEFPKNELHEALSREIEEFLESHGSHPVRQALLGRGPLQGIFEDPLTVVGYVVYESVGEMLDSWLDAQDQMARAIGQSKFDLGAKAWDGYLILATPERATSDQSVELTAIRTNTRRLRKLLILGDEGQSQSYLVSRSLAALAPLDLPINAGMTDPLAGLPSRIQVPGLLEDDIQEVVNAYRESRPLIQVLHERTSGKDLP
jgi:hypothetical protein